MIRFTCECGNTLYFENSVCLSCGRTLGFLPDANVISALEAEDGAVFHALANNRRYRACRNYTEYEICNWMVPAEEKKDYCESCRLNEIIPNLSEPQNIRLWYRIERAKRRLLYTLKRIRLPIKGRAVDPVGGLSFRFMADESEKAEFDDEYSPGERIMTGHRTGTITINLAEADSSAREEIREKMNERYRTLLGHFRHESGHYYWDKLVKDTDWIEEYRRLFGDETRDYSVALDTYYKNGPPANWEQQWISAYASAHPWEDFAESWAHYLHMVDTLETAHDYDFALQGLLPTSKSGDMQYGSGYTNDLSDLSSLMDDWTRLTSALNAMSRSMGVRDMYPFVLTEVVKAKLEMIHRLIFNSRV